MLSCIWHRSNRLIFITFFQMIKILFIITKSDVGGAQKYIDDLANNLNKENFEVVILYGGKDLKWLSNKTYPWFLFFNDWLAIFELIKTYKKERPQIIHLNSSKAGVLGSIAAKLYNVMCYMTHVACCKVIFTAHGWVFNPTNAVFYPIRQFYALLHKIAAMLQHKIICVSDHDYQLALRYKISPFEKLTTIHNGIDTDISFLEKQAAKELLLKKISSEPQILNKPWVGSVGRLTKEKNYQTLIKAATLAPDAYFFIIGTGPKLKKHKKEILKHKLLNRFFIIEPTGIDAVYLKAFDIFAMSSIKEGLPYILLEAMVAEIPVVVTESGGMPEVVKHNQNGLVVKQKNPKMLAQTINKLLKNPDVTDKFKKAASKTVKEKFNLKEMIHKTEMIYKSVMN